MCCDVLRITDFFLAHGNEARSCRARFFDVVYVSLLLHVSDVFLFFFKTIRNLLFHVAYECTSLTRMHLANNGKMAYRNEKWSGLV